MADDLEFVAALVAEVLTLLEPLEQTLSHPGGVETLLLEQGWVPPADGGALEALRAAVRELVDVAALSEAFDAAFAGAPDPAAVAAVLDLVSAVLGGLRSPSAGPAGLPPPLDDPQFWAAFLRELGDGLFARWLHRRLPVAFATLHLLGFVDVRRVTPDGQGRVPYQRTRVRWEQLGRALTDPAAQLRETYGWGVDFDAPLLVERVCVALTAFGVLAEQRVASEAVLRRFWRDRVPPAALPAVDVALVRDGRPGDPTRVDLSAELVPVPAPAAPAGAAAWTGVALLPVFTGVVDVTLPLSASLGIELTGGVEGLTALAVELQPDRGPRLTWPGAAPVVDIGATLRGAPEQPFLLIGTRGSHRIELGGVEVGLAVHDLVAPDPELRLVIALSRLALTVQLADGDGFINKIFGTAPQTLQTDARLVWSSRTGLAFEGQAGLRLRLPVNVELGPVTLREILLEINASTGGGVRIAGGLTVAADLGPLALSVQEIGVVLTLRPDDTTPNVGGLAVGWGFQPPRGVGLVITAPTVTGGGFLLLDPERGEYAGVLQLAFAGIALSAVGIITTRPGEFSLLVIISLEFSPFQLGYGFTLNGVGGLLALNRTIDTRAIAEGLAQGALDAILFPRNPVGNAPQLITALNRYFPPAPGQFVFGPAVVLGWGTPTLLTITLGVLVELPSPLRIVLAGVLRMVLPDPDTAIASITVDVLGSLDLTNRRLEIDAGLRDSQVAGFTLTGDLAVRASWGREPGFLLAAGGFHPRSRPPGSVRRLQRLAIALGTGDNPRLRLEAYLAITSNTVQFGARLDLYAAVDLGIGRFSVAATVGFDALIQFSPFRFEVDLYASVALLWNDRPFLGIALRATLSGPQPWRARGEASFTFIATFTVGFEITVGDEPPPQPPELVDVLGLVTAALLDPRNWQAQHPADDRRTMVTLRSRPAAVPELVVHPLGELTVRQQVVPLQRDITRFGAGRPNVTRFELTLRAPDGTVRTPAPVDGPFARAQFLDLSDAEKLTAPAFDPMPCGGTFSGGGWQLPPAGRHDYGEVSYDERLLDGDDSAHAGPPTPRPLLDGDLQRLTLAGAVASNGGTGTRDARLLGRPAGIDTQPLTFQLISLDGMSPVGGQAPGSFGVAVDELRRRLAARPDLVRRLAVGASHEAHA